MGRLYRPVLTPCIALILLHIVQGQVSVKGNLNDLHLDIKIGQELGEAEHKTEQSTKGKPAVLSQEDEDYIDAIVANVTSIRKQMDESGMTEALLRGRLQMALLEQRSQAAADAASRASQNARPVCPPPGFDAISPFSIADYISASWYIQQQMLVAYQPRNSLFCVKATYLPVDPNNLLAGLNVFNFANTGGVNMNPSPENAGIQLRARVYNASAPSKLAVGPYFSGPLANLTLGLLGLTDVPSFFTGPYWVVAAGPKTFGDPDFNGYEWAIVSGGPPAKRSNGACKTGNGLPPQLQVNGIGYWYFTRVKVASKELLAEMEEVGKKLGFDNSVLLPVQQEGCTYEGSVDVPE